MNTTTKARNRILSFALAVCLLLTMVLVVPGPVEVSAAPSGGVGDANDGIDFDDLIGSGIYFGTYKHQLTDNTWETNPTPVLWRGMGEDDGSSNLTLLSEYALDSKPYFYYSSWNSAQDGKVNIWEISELRAWLNNLDFIGYGELNQRQVTGSSPFDYSVSGGFLESFTDMEQAAMDDIPVKTSTYGWDTTVYESGSTRTTTDKIYIPWGTRDYGSHSDKNKVLWNADDESSSFPDKYDLITKTATYKGGGNGDEVNWWLRSPFSADSTYALCVHAAGSVSFDGVPASRGVRPAFQLNPSSVIFTSKIADGANIANGEKKDEPYYYTGEAGRENFKLTVVNDSIGTLTNIPASNATVPLNSSASSFWLTDLVPSQTGGDYTVNYKIVNNAGTRAIQGYGFTEAEDLTQLEIDTSGLSDGTYIVYVWLQKNNDFHSHEGTKPQYFTLEVSGSGDTYDISLASESDPLDFGSEEVNYAPVTPKVVRITTTTGVTSFDIRLGGDHPGSFVITNENVNGFDIAPVDGLGAGTYEATVTVAGNYAKPQTLDVIFVVTAGSGNPSATLTIGHMNDDNVEENQPYSKTIPVNYQNGTASSLSYKVTGLPVGLSSYSLGHSGEISGTPTETGTFTVNVLVEDGMGAADSGSYTLTVTALPATQTQLTLATPTDLTVTEGEPFTKTFSVTYTGTTDPLTYTISGLPGGVHYSPTTGEITGPATESGTFPIDIEVTDGVEQDTGSFILTVLPASTPPPPQTSYTITATAGEGGRINPSGSVTVAEGADQAFTIEPNRGYSIYDVVVDGANIGAVTSYPFTDVRADHTITASFIKDGATDPSPTPNSGTRSSGGSSSGGSTYTLPPKTTLPTSAFSWDGGRTLTINHDSITTLGLLSVRWNDITLTRGADFTAHQGSVIIRFSQDFIDSQTPGNHTVRVEFLNHTGETTVTVGDTGTAGMEVGDNLFDNDTQNPSTGGDSHNPNTGDGSPFGVWAALLLGSLSAGALVIFGRKESETR